MSWIDFNGPFSGVGLRPEHYPYIEESLQSSEMKNIRWFEAIGENYMDSQGRPRQFLRKIRQDFPVALHCVSMNLGHYGGVDKGHLQKLKILVDEISPMIVSDHLCWTGLPEQNLHDLLPLPYTAEVIEVMVRNIDTVQNALKRPLVLENVSTYLSFTHSELTEWEFISEILRRTGSQILLDVNNVYVSAVNLGFRALDFIQGLDLSKVAQVHLAGFTDMGSHLFDTHSKAVCPEVWELFSHVVGLRPDVPFMVEWDDDIPDFPILLQEVQKGVDIWHHQKAEERLCAPVSL